MATRQVHAFRLILDRRKLARFETALGLLGWQQAEYDAATQAHVNRLTNYEREQLRLTNESAALGIEIKNFEEQRGIAEREFNDAQVVALEKEHPAAANLAGLEEQLAAQRKERKAIEARLPVLDRELAAAEAEYRTLVSGSSAVAAQDELFRLRKVILAIPGEKADWQGRLAVVEAQIAAVETFLGNLKEARAAYEKRDEEMAGKIAARQRAKRKVEKQIDTVEKAKADPYREIGRALADHHVAPLNQPAALHAVLEQRGTIAAREAVVAASRAESARAGWTKSAWFSLLACGLIGSETALLLAMMGR